MSRRLDISSLLCDEPPKKERPVEPQVVAEPVVLAPHLVRNRYDQSKPPKASFEPKFEPKYEPKYEPPKQPELPLDTLARAAALAEKHRDPHPEPPFARTPHDPQILLSPVQDHHRLRTMSRHVLEQQQQQQHQHHLRILQQQENARHEQMMLQAQWDRDRARAADGLGRPMGLPVDLRPARKSDPGQVRPLTSPAPSHLIGQHHQQMEPPNKKRRYSDSPVSNGFEWERTSSLTRPGERSILNPEVDFVRPDVQHRPSSSSSSSSHGAAAPIQSPPFPPGRRSPPGSLSGRAKARKSDPEEPDVIPYTPDRYNATTVIHLPEREREDYVVEDRKHKKPQPRFIEYAQGAGPSRRPEPPQQQPPPPQQQQDTRPHVPPQRRPQPPPARQPKEEDPHEWLLEQFTDPSPDAQRRKPDPPKPLSPVPPTSLKSQSPVHTTTKQASSPIVPATEAAAALEEELSAVHIPAPSKAEPKDDEMDVDLTVAETLPKHEEGMDVDVEDELLSLVDDRPRSRSTTAPSMSRAPSGSSSKPALRLQSETGSRSGSPVVSASSPMIPPSERGSMPPPASTATGQSKSKESAPRKKETGTKAAPKPKATGAAAKPRARPAPKPKAKVVPDAGPGPATAKAKAPSAISRKSGSVAASVSRSRSTSVMPGGSVGPDGSEKPEDEEDEALAPAEDDKLYCICKTKYDEDRFMIACDKCDEWYHTHCVDMPDLVVDLVDQFFCPLCIEKNPHLSLKTTYKPRCRHGLDHPEPDSPKACHKPAQGAFSKYCSPECGLNNVKKRIDTFAKNGGKKELLWDSVRDAQKREAVVIVHTQETVDGCTKENGDVAVAVPVPTARVKPPTMGKVEREVASLNAVLDEIVTMREDLKEGMDIVRWRERLLDLASERAEQVGQCGWDQRLCFGDDEWADFGAGVLESYEEGGGRDGMQVDGAPEAEEWWCVEGEKCERHAGWQLIRSNDIAKEKEKKEDALYRLTTREREIRKRIEDIVEPYNRSRCLDPGAAPLKSSKLVNGNSKGKTTNGDSKKGKKRKKSILSLLYFYFTTVCISSCALSLFIETIPAFECIAYLVVALNPHWHRVQ
ncbi:PHD-type domain-containing protein [Mycena sanguinolenta]|uniref:PHD-type domain-containing protein n=1 Tax=Mycena sanguinolenta TaxID=230812 RepID=A0A8H7CKF2_9AGAR|nr:PHD-type domain-containing protein [Mycena sanguinolenta]